VSTPSPDRPHRLLTFTGYAQFVLIGWNGTLIPSLIRSVEHDFRQSDAAFGLFYLLGALVYAFGAFSGGLLTERLGRRPVLYAALASLGLGLLGEAGAPTWPLLFVAAVLVNWGGGTIDGGTNGLFLDLYRDARGGALSLLHVFFSVGAFIAPFAIGELVTVGVPWRLIVAGTACCTAPLLGLIGVLTMPSGRHARAEKAQDHVELSGAERTLVPFVGLAVAIGLYVAAEVAVSNWVVKLLVPVPLATATAILSIFWGGLTLGRILSNLLAERIDYFAFTIGCALLASLSLLGAVVAPSLVAAGALFGLCGMFFGPVYPMIMAIGGNIYPHRLSALSGGLAAAAVCGATIYPPLMGLMAARVGLRLGMVGAALLGLPLVACLLLARATARRAAQTAEALPSSSPLRRTGR
jgi:fucose permease